MKNIIENNKLIAEFMGVFDKILSTGNIHSWSDAPFYYTTEDTREKVIKNISKYSKYSKDWNWLMQVVNKIENMGNDVLITSNYVQITYNEGENFINLELKGNIMLEAVYSNCVEFIKWHNKNN